MRGVDDLGAGLRQLGPDQHRHQAADEEEEEGGADVLDADHLVIGVEAEVVLPALSAVLRVVLGDRRHADGPAQPVVEAAEAEQEAERAGDQRNDHLWVAGLFGLVGGQAETLRSATTSAEAEGGTQDRAERAPNPARSLDRSHHQLASIMPLRPLIRVGLVSVSWVIDSSQRCRNFFFQAADPFLEIRPAFRRRL